MAAAPGAPALALLLATAFASAAVAAAAAGRHGAPSCTLNKDCSADKACIKGACAEPCAGACGMNTHCRVFAHYPVCKCLTGFAGDPVDRCYPINDVVYSYEGSRCSVDSDCSSENACLKGKCRHACSENPCGVNAICRAVRHTHLCAPARDDGLAVPWFDAIHMLSSPKGGKCSVDSDCSSDNNCWDGRCRLVCSENTCGVNADCRAARRTAVCSCRRGWVGNALIRCDPKDNSASAPSSPLPPLALRLSSPPSPQPSPPQSDWLPALHRACLLCLCKASTGCKLDLGCSEGYCGPFGVSRIYWHEAGRPVLANDDPERKESYEDCAQLYECSGRIVTNYMLKLAKDCNGDGWVNCDDFAMAHHNGGYTCHLPLNRTAFGIKYQQRYTACRGEVEDDDPLGLAVKPH